MTGCDGPAHSAELIELGLAARYDERALEELVRATSAPVRRFCAALVDSPAADDLAQETFLRAVRSLHSYRGTASPLAWLFTIARRVCADEIARRQRARTLELRLRSGVVTSRPDDTGLVELTDAIDRLDPDRRRAFVLTAVAGLSYADAAQLCECPVGTIRSRVARARDDLVRACSQLAVATHADPVAAEPVRTDPAPAARELAIAVAGR